jgi:hypothetical protein
MAEIRGNTNNKLDTGENMGKERRNIYRLIPLQARKKTETSEYQ